jgi:hypothetical protein
MTETAGSGRKRKNKISANASRETDKDGTKIWFRIMVNGLFN